MATISAMASNTYTMYRLGQTGNTSLFQSADTFNGVNTGSAVNAASSTMTGLLGIRSGLADMVDSYDKASSEFKAEFSSSMTDLTKASAALKATDFGDVGGESAITKTTKTDADGNEVTTTTKSDKLKAAIKSVTDFTDAYNSAVGFFNDNADVSKYTANLQKVFSDTTYRSSSLSEIGITVASDGKMTVDEDKLAEAITKNPSKVENTLGGDGGLADKADSHVSFAKSQESRLFPSLSSSMKGAVSSTSMYTGSSLLAISSYANVGTLLNMWA